MNKEGNAGTQLKRIAQSKNYKILKEKYPELAEAIRKEEIAVRPCQEDEKDSFRWRSAGNKLKPKQITCKVFFAKIMSLMGWNPNNRYKLLGKLIESGGELLFTFDLKTPEIFQRITKEDGSVKASRIPQYPEEWKNQFGLPVDEHRESLQVNIFEGYAVFGIKKEKDK